MDNVLIIGASSELATEVLPVLIQNGGKIGLHYSLNKDAVEKYEKNKNVVLIQKTISNEDDCRSIVENYIQWAGSIDGIVIFMGNISSTCHWSEITTKELENEYLYNTVYPFLLAQNAVKFMQEIQKGRILFISTASVKRGGGSTTIGYGMAKAALECMMKRLARDLAPDGILVNAVAPGFFDTKFNRQRKNLSDEDVARRIEMIPLKRSGSKKEIAGCILYMLSESAGFITGQVITVDGGDFL